MEFTDSSLAVCRILSQSIYNPPGRTHAIDRITVHQVVGIVTAEALGQNMYYKAAQVSSNYGVDKDGRVGQYVLEQNISQCSSSRDNDNRAITIECASQPAHPYQFPDATYRGLIELCIDILRRYGKRKLLWIEDKNTALAYEPAGDEMILTVHWWFMDTDCPGAWMMAHMGDLAAQVTAALAGDPAEDAPAETPAAEQPFVSDTNVGNKTDPVKGMQAKDLGALSNAQIVEKMGPLFTEDQRKTGVPACVSMAQFILESGYCRTELAQNANNCFGMKALVSGNAWPGSAWDGQSKYRMATEEYSDDGSAFTIRENFRAYACVEDSIADHSAYLVGAKLDDGSLRYQGLRGCTDAEQAAQIIKRGGYATAPDYASVLCNLIKIWGLDKFNAPEEPDAPNADEETIRTVTILKTDWDAMRAAVSVAGQIVRKYEGAL